MPADFKRADRVAERVRARFPVSIAEVGDLTRWQVATLGVAVVANETARCQEVLSAVSRAAEQANDAVLSDVATEIVPFGAGGKGIAGGIEQALSRSATSRRAGSGSGEEG